MTLRAEIYEERIIPKDVDNSIFDMSEEIFLGTYELACIPRSEDWLSLRAIGASSRDEEHCFNIYRVKEVWHEAIHAVWDVTADKRCEQLIAPVTKIYVTFSHTVEPGLVRSRHSGKRSLPLRRAKQEAEV